MNKVHYLSLPSGNQIGYLGPPLDEGKLPSLFYFALSITDNLSIEPYNQPVQFLLEKSFSNLRIFSWTLPGHDNPALSKDREVLAWWANEIRAGNLILEKFIDTVIADIFYLIEQQIIPDQNLACMGLSRGTWIATQIAAQLPIFTHLLGFAPLTNLATIPEFADLIFSEHALPFDLRCIASKLIHTHIRFYIGNRDVRVDTNSCFHLIRNIADAAYRHRIYNSPAELIITSSTGHQGHGTSPQRFADGAEWLFDQWFSPQHSLYLNPIS